MILWMDFSFSFSVTYTTTLIFPKNSVLSQIFSSKIYQRAIASQISYLKLITTVSKPVNFSDSIKLSTYENTTLEALTMFHSSRNESMAYIYTIDKKHQESI